MIEKTGKILQVDSRYALVQLTNKTNNNFITKLYTALLSKHSANITTTIRARNFIYAQPNDRVIIGMPAQRLFPPINQTNNCSENAAIILRCTAPMTKPH